MPKEQALSSLGLIDELFGIEQGSVKLSGSKFAPGGEGISEESTRTINLNSAEELYAEIRSINFNAVGPTLSRKARNISAQFQVIHPASIVAKTPISA